jgi:hypothetical protein
MFVPLWTSEYDCETQSEGQSAICEEKHDPRLSLKNFELPVGDHKITLLETFKRDFTG